MERAQARRTVSPSDMGGRGGGGRCGGDEAMNKELDLQSHDRETEGHTPSTSPVPGHLPTGQISLRPHRRI